MVRARQFFLVAAGMFLLALSYHFGASTATAQAPGNPIVGIAADGGNFVVVTGNGDTYHGDGPSPWAPGHNVFVGSPTPAVRESWGQLKARYRPAPGMTATPGTDNR